MEAHARPPLLTEQVRRIYALYGMDGPPREHASSTDGGGSSTADAQRMSPPSAQPRNAAAASCSSSSVGATPPTTIAQAHGGGGGGGAAAPPLPMRTPSELADISDADARLARQLEQVCHSPLATLFGVPPQSPPKTHLSRP